MRKPNGYGSIKKLSGNRRRPFVFVVSAGKKQKPVEYFTTQIEAEIFQADYSCLLSDNNPAPTGITIIVIDIEIFRSFIANLVKTCLP